MGISAPPPYRAVLGEVKMRVNRPQPLAAQWALETQCRGVFIWSDSLFPTNFPSSCSCPQPSPCLYFPNAPEVFCASWVLLLSIEERQQAHAPDRHPSAVLTAVQMLVHRQCLAGQAQRKVRITPPLLSRTRSSENWMEIA